LIFFISKKRRQVSLVLI